MISAKRTPFYDKHVQLGGRLVDFAGWALPLHYGSQIDEHRQVRSVAGIFDVSHMTVSDISGPDAIPYLRRVLANSVDKLRSPGRALYSCLLNENAGIIDDAVLYRLPTFYRLVSNAGTRERVRTWLTEQTSRFNVSVAARDDLAMLAVQGPQSLERLKSSLPSGLFEQIIELKPFTAYCSGEDLLIARTGYTGEDGVEIISGREQALELWDGCIAAGIAPIGLGARDSLRLEAGMNLYGTDMDEAITPWECGLAWTVDEQPREPNFIGAEKWVERRDQGLRWRQIGLVLLEKGVLRGQQRLEVPNLGDGVITSGGYAPSLDRSIALARVPPATEPNNFVTVDVRGRSLKALTVTTPFVRRGSVRITLPQI